MNAARTGYVQSVAANLLYFFQVPLFPVFTRSGEVTVSIDLVREGVTFTQSEMRRFEGFHKFVFSRVLRLDKDPMLFLPSDAPYSCLVVPVLSGKALFCHLF